MVHINVTWMWGCWTWILRNIILCVSDCSHDDTAQTHYVESGPSRSIVAACWGWCDRATMSTKMGSNFSQSLFTLLNWIKTTTHIPKFVYSFWTQPCTLNLNLLAYTQTKFWLRQWCQSDLYFSHHIFRNTTNIRQILNTAIMFCP